MAAVAFSGCDSTKSKDLSRSAAKKVIESNEKFMNGPLTLELDQAQVKAGLKEGYWVVLDQYGSPLELTKKGKQYFAGFQDQLASLVTGKRTVRFVKGLKPEVLEITGLSDAAGAVDGNLKQVDFVWKVKIAPGVAKDLNIKPETSSVLLKRYDDGWRLETE